MINIIRGVVATLFIIGLIWAAEAIFSHSSAYIMSVAKSIFRSATPGVCLMLPGIGWGIYEIYKRNSK